MKNATQMIVFALVATLLLLVAMDYALSMPEVLVSYSSRDCVGVNNFPGFFFNQEVFSCENLPSKFDHVWVK